MRLCRYLPAVGRGRGVRRFSVVTEEGGVKGRKCFCCFFDFFPFPQKNLVLLFCSLDAGYNPGGVVGTDLSVWPEKNSCFPF